MLQGDTRNLPLSNLFQTLALNQQEGVLSIFYRKMERSIAIRGSDVYIISERPYSSILLPQVLARLNVLTTGEYQNVFATMTEPKPPGNVLIERHLLTEEQVYGSIREHMFERLFETFEWIGARYKFEVKPVEDNRLIFSDTHYQSSMALPVNSVLMEVARREDEWKRIREQITNVHQIFRISTSAENFESPDGLDLERLSRLFSQFDGEQTIQEILLKSEVPEFFVYSTLRCLLDEELVTPVSLDEKKALAERLRNKFQLDRVAEIYKSILAEDPQQVDVRKKLVLFLERKKSDPNELVEHYRELAREARRQGLEEDELEQFEKLREIAPDDTEALAELARLALESGRERDWIRNLGAYVDAVQKAKDYRAGAAQLTLFSQMRPEDGTLLTEAANFLFQDGDKEAAGTAYGQAAEHYESKGDLANLKRVVSRLEQCKPEEAARWKETFAPSTPPRSKRRAGSKTFVAGATCATLLLALCGLGVFEFLAWSARASAASRARSYATVGELNRAKNTLAEFREGYSMSMFSSSTDAIDREIELIAERVASHDSGSEIDDPPKITTTDDGDAVPQEAEAILSRAARLTQRGDYTRALGLYMKVDSRFLSETVAKSVIHERKRLSRYLDEAKRLANSLTAAEKKNDFESANRICKRMLYDYSFSPETKKIQVPVSLQVSPPSATVVVGSVIVHGPPYVVHVSPSENLVIDVTAEGFEPQVVTIDPLEKWTVKIHLQREIERRIALDAIVEAGPAISDDVIFVGTRSGRVFAYSLSDGTEIWAHSLDELGDVMGQIRRYQTDILFLGTDGAIYRISETGQLIFRDKIPTRLGYPNATLTQPDSNGLVFLTTRHGFAIGYDVEKGKRAWDRQLTNGPLSGAAVVGDRVVVTDPQGRIYCLESQTGDMAWKVDIDVLIGSAPVFAKDRILVACLDNHLYALGVGDGQILWKQPLPTSVRVTPTVVGDTYVAITQLGTLISGSLATGTPTYQVPHRGRFTIAKPVCDGSQVYVVDDEGVANAFDLESGKHCWKYRTDSKPGSVPVLDGKRLILTAVENGLHVLRVDRRSEPSQ